jgi:hypothetical protein
MLFLNDVHFRKVCNVTYVQFQYSGFKDFRFECHFPYPALRFKIPSGMRGEIFDPSHSRKSWSNLSFLNLHLSSPSKEGSYVICELHSSLVVSGWDDSKWAAYGFTNTDPESDDETDTLDDEQDDATLDEIDDEYDVSPTDWGLEDRLASDGGSDVVSREHPIWDPRLYFLQLTDLRLRAVRKEWSYLVHKIVASVKNQVIVQCCRLSQVLTETE